MSKKVKELEKQLAKISGRILENELQIRDLRCEVCYHSNLFTAARIFKIDLSTHQVKFSTQEDSLLWCGEKKWNKLGTIPGCKEHFGRSQAFPLWVWVSPIEEKKHAD